ncbi:non-ribosomal peptide synthetase, partial [Paenibacillus fonticola]|uniref:non-ribosomal peptide synthetase n=1 Tax=Paenibacillus fonticola TaxID=379896 RepID=UPI001F0A4253
MKVGLFHTADGDHLLLCLHHLVVDGVSWRILLEDLKAGYEQALQGKEVVLPAKTASYKDWAEALVEYSQSTELKQEINYWREICKQVKDGKIQGDFDGQPTEYAHMQLELEMESTQQLLYEAGKAYGTEINDLLLSALGMAVKQWKGQNYVAVEMEGHGREEIHKAVKMDRTVGWFTSVYPIVLKGSEAPEEAIINTKEMLRTIPNHGIGYGVAACLGQDKWPDVEAGLCFNYLGHMDHEFGAEGRITVSNLSCGSSIAEENMPKQGITMNGSVSGGKLRFAIAYNKGRYSGQSIAQFCQNYVQSIQMIVQHCVFQKEVIKTASDFGALNMNASDFKQLTQRHPVPEISGIYSLTPMQEGMLYHKLADEQSTGYVLQFKLRMKGKLQVVKVRESLSLLAMKHDVLRTVFFYNKVSKPWQIVLREREIECNVIDLSCSKEQDNEIMKIQQADILRGFNLEEDSLLRATILRKSEEEHILLWSSHHITMDGWSLPLLFRDFVLYYEALTEGSTLSSLHERVREEAKGVVSYGEYIRWLEKQDREEGLSFWENSLADYTEAAEIQPLSPSGNIEEQVKEEVCITDKQLTRQLQRLSSTLNITINTIVETAWGVILQKYNRNTDVVFGKVVSGRNASIQGMEQAVGLFINTIPIRVKCKESTTVEELLGQMQQQAVAGMGYDYCSLAEVQSRSALGNNLIRTLFVFENYYVDESFKLESHELKIEIESAREQTNYDISLSAFIKEAALTLKIMYDPGKYGAEEIQTLLGRMEQLLQQMTSNPKQKVSELRVVDEEEKRLVIETFNDTAAEYPRGKTVVELFEEQVQRTPDHIAVVFEDEKMSYAMLNERANQLAYKLRELGVKPDDFVAILAERSIEMIIGIYGIMKAGGAYVPVDPSYPENRIQYMLEDCRPKAILLGNAELPIKGDTPVIDLFDKEVYTGEATNPEHVNTPQDLMYIIYTSGTTGKPKGVMIEHEGVVNFREYFIKNHAITAADVVLQFASFSFDATVSEMTMSLLAGAQLCLCTEDVQKDVRLFEQYIDKHKVTIAILPPQYLAQVDIRQLRAVITAGSETNRELVCKNNKHMKYSNDYGPTEATVCATHWECDPGEPIPERVPIGKPIENKQIYIMNGNDLCGIGMPGELCIAGVGLARGYLNRPELTAEQFVENHFGEGRMYRSGDLARWLPDGNIEYMGRIDEQVKIRGFRVELGEIESVLRKQPGVIDVAVVAKENNGDNSICAYVVSDQDQELRSGDIKDSLRKELPEYMVPAYIMQIESVPLNRNGKLDKHALPEPEAASGQQYIAPRNEIEEIVAGAFAEVLGVSLVGIEDNFFELGGHSLRATRVVNQIEVKTGVRLPLKAIFAAPTAQLLAKEVEQAKEEAYIPIPKAEKKEVYPMSSAQKRLYLLNQIDDAGIAYNIPAGMFIHGNLDMDRMKYALEQLTIRHEALRTSFHMQDGEPVQKIAQEVQLELEYEERIAGAEQEENLLHDFVHPFDLGKAPLIRIKAVKIGKDKTVLLLDMHHIISDGVSMGILTQELSRLYNGEQLQPLSVQYKDYSEWMQTRDLSEQKKYWLDVFKEPAPVLDLQLDYLRPQTQSFKGHCINGMLTAKQKKAVDELCRKTGATAYMVLLSTMMVLLGKYSRQEDIIIGSPISGRTHKDTEQMMGMFVNTLAMRGYPNGDKKVLDFLKEIKESALKAYDNQEYPFEELVESVEVRRDLSRNPLFDVMLVLQNNEQTNLEMNGLQMTSIGSEHTIAKFDLTLSIGEMEDGYAMTWEYCTDLFEQESVEQMMKHFSHLVDELTANPEVKISELGVVDEEEKRLVIETFNDTATEYPREKTVVELFEEQVQKTPDHIAIVFEDEIMSYAMLNEKANQLAYKLRELGVRPDDRVAILAQRSMEMIIGIYGIIKAGGAYVPIDPSYPENRIQYMLEDCRPKAILLGRAELPIKGDTPVIDLYDKEVYTGKAVNPEHVNTPQDLMYIIYTSGTTGKPKGVMIEHEGVVNFREYFIKNYAITAADVVLQFASFSFDASVYEMTMSLLVGAQLCLCPEDVKKDARLFEQYIDKHNVTIAILPPQYLAQVDIRHFRAIITGGSETNRELVGANNKHMKYSNDYGPTEATVCATHWECDPGEPVPERIPIGKPIENKQIYIMNGNDLCGIGMPGELCIAGVGLSRGYLNRPELTAEKFVENHFGEGRMYRSGDLARWLPDGNIEYMGRIDEQVKIRGFRVELGEIESVLRKQPGVNDVAVAVKEKNGDKSICAYVVSDQELRSGDIKDSLRKELPEYMVPAYIVQIESIPLTRNGKLDKHALPEPEAAGGQQYIAPRNEIEEIVAGAFAEVLGVTPVGIEDNFFELGGHSLRATRVVNQIEVKTGIRLPLKAIFAAPTAQLLAKEVEQAKEEAYIPIPKAEEKEVYPMSSAQKRLYLINQIDDTGIAYNIPAGLVIYGNLDMDRMKYALEQLTIRHEALRTSFHMQDGEPVQKIAQEVQLELEYEERIAGAEQEENLLYDFVHPFNLGKAPLMRMKAVKIGEDKTILLLDMHHIISDGMSMGILTQELSKLYNGEQLQPLSVQYKDYSEWMRTRDLSEQKKYWLDVFKEPAPVLDLQLDYLRPQTKSFKGHCINGMLTAKQKKAVDELCRKTGATAYMVLLSTMMVLLGKYSRQEDIVVGSPISGRTHKDTEQMMGMFVNTLAMRAYPKGDKKVLDFLKEVKENALKAYENQEYPFEELVESVEVQRDLSRNPLFDVMFVLQNNEQANLAMNGFKMTSIDSEHTVAKFDLSLSISVTEDGYAMTWEYCTDLLKLESVEQMMKHFSHLVDELAANPERKISELSVADEEEKRLIIEAFNDTAAEYPREKTVVELFEEQVQQTPDHIAVVFEDEKMSYAQLNEKANQLAYKLRELGVKPDDYVALLAERSIEMIIGVYGIIKAGGAYVPIDPGYPQDRIVYMLSDCKPKAVVTYNTEIQTEIPLIDLGESKTWEGVSTNPVLINKPSDLLYLIYTSGTTGKPKGVMIENTGVNNLRSYFMDSLKVTSKDRILQFSNIAFDGSVWDMTMALLTGGTLYVIHPDKLSDSEYIGEYAGETTIMAVPPQFYAQINTSGQRLIITAGSESSKDVISKAVEISSYLNSYGPTEVTVCATQWLCEDKNSIPDRIPIGKPIQNKEIYILNGSTLCGIGIPGELCVAGVGLARGYLNQPELTAEKFVENLFGEGRMYRSGDLARWLPDGNVEYMGRIDEQVKIRGFRVELGEIESVLRKQPGVKEVAVAVKEKNGDKSICAYVVSDQQIRTSDIKDNLRIELPEYMVPAYIVQIESIPVNRNGKLDKHALPEPEATSRQKYITPRNEIEKTVACAFKEVLGVTPVGIEDNFFEMGGDSIKAIRVVSKIREAGYELAVKDLMQLRIVKLIAEKTAAAEM